MNKDLKETLIVGACVWGITIVIFAILIWWAMC